MTDDTDDNWGGFIELPATVEELEWKLRIDEYRDTHDGAPDLSDREIVEILVISDGMDRFHEAMMAAAKKAGLKTRAEREEEARRLEEAGSSEDEEK